MVGLWALNLQISSMRLRLVSFQQSQLERGQQCLLSGTAARCSHHCEVEVWILLTIVSVTVKFLLGNATTGSSQWLNGMILTYHKHQPVDDGCFLCWPWGEGNLQRMLTSRMESQNGPATVSSDPWSSLWSALQSDFITMETLKHQHSCPSMAQMCTIRRLGNFGASHRFQCYLKM